MHAHWTSPLTMLGSLQVARPGTQGAGVAVHSLVSTHVVPLKP